MTSKSISINRAPVLTLWAAVVAERLGFDEDEGLRLGKALAGLTAQTKGRRLGIYKPHEEGAKEAREKGRGQEFGIELCGRPLPAKNTEDEQDRGDERPGVPGVEQQEDVAPETDRRDGRSPVVPQQGLEVVRSEMDPSIPDRASVSDGAGLGATILRAQRPEGGNPIPSHRPPPARCRRLALGVD